MFFQTHFFCHFYLSSFIIRIFFMTILNGCANDNDERTLLGASVVGKAITYFPWNKIQVHVPPYSLNNFPNIPQNVTKYIEKKKKNYWTELHKHAIKGKAKFFLSILSRPFDRLKLPIANERQTFLPHLTLSYQSAEIFNRIQQRGKSCSEFASVEFRGNYKGILQGRHASISQVSMWKQSNASLGRTILPV